MSAEFECRNCDKSITHRAGLEWRHDDPNTPLLRSRQLAHQHPRCPEGGLVSIDETRARDILTQRLADDFANDPDLFARVAGLLGYVKADSEEWGVKLPGGGVSPSANEFNARAIEELPGWGTVRRTVGHGPWEAVSDAEQ